MLSLKDNTSTTLARFPEGEHIEGPVIDDVLWHSSGKMIFVTGNSGKAEIGYEHWIMENFLPKK